MESEIGVLYLYKVKGYDGIRSHKFNLLIAAYSLNEAIKIGEGFGMVESAKEMNKNVIINKGDQDDQSE